ncbi:MAG TPA: DUF2842 domain-containing protein [Methylovirgula sp.]|nr:DUF2842 domain-containing protein [Methylovirgula sp.]
MGGNRRKFLGAVLMLAFVIVYALVAMALAQTKALQQAPGLVQALCYGLIGMAWILPVMPLIKWMERRD